MKLSHLAFGIVLIIAVIVAAIITAFSIVTFESLDKAVENSMTSELDYVKNAVNSLIERTVVPVTAARDMFLGNNWTYRNLPARGTVGTADEGMDVTSLQNWTGAFAVMTTLLQSNKDLLIYCYFTGKSPVDEATWSDFGAQANPDGSILLYVPDLYNNLTYFDSSDFPRSPMNTISVGNQEYTATGQSWQITAASLSKNESLNTHYSFCSVYYDAVADFSTLAFSYSLPVEFNETSGMALSAFSVDVDASLVARILRELATKDNKLFVIDARKTRVYDGGLISSSLPSSELPPYDPATNLVYFPTATPNSEVNALLSRVFEEYGGFENVKTAKNDIIIENYEGYIIAAAHVYAPGNFHWLVVSAVPREYYYGSTTNTIGGTIGGGIALLILASLLIVYIMLQQQKLVDGSRQSAEIAQTVARNLVLYNTEDATIVIEKALQPTIEVFAGMTTDKDGNDVEQLREETNYSNRDLVLALKQINENLQVYKPHLPEYVLPQKMIDEDEAQAKNAEIDEELLEMNDDGHLASTGGGSSQGDKRPSRSTGSSNGGGAKRIPMLEDVYKKKHNADMHTFEVNMDESAGASHATNADENTDGSKNSKNSKQSGTNISANNTSNSAHTTAPIARLALMRHSGDTVDRVVMANLNLSRAHEVLFPTSAFVSVSKSVSINNVNKMIENILETASANDATVHSIIGDNITATWNATSRTVHADVKAMRFVTTVDNLVKKELHEFYKGGGNNNTNDVSAFHDPHRFVISGGVVNGSAWCQLAGSTKRQQFTLLNFSEAPVLSTVTELGQKSKFVAVCRTINQNCQHEFVFRGASVHVLPGNENVLFPNNNNNLAATAGANDSCRDSSFGRLPHANSSVSSSTGQQQQQVHEQVPAISISTKKQQQQATRNGAGRSMLALPVYELCSRKNLTAEDEWLYVVGDESKNKNAQAYSAAERKQNIKKEQQHQQQLAAFFNELVINIARGNSEKANGNLKTILEFDQEAQFLPAYQNLKSLFKRM